MAAKPKPAATPNTVEYEPHFFRLPGSLLASYPCDRLAISGTLQQAFRVISQFLLADATNAGFPPEAVTGMVDFPYQDTIPWAALSCDLLDSALWVIIPRVKQHLMAFKAYFSEAQSVLLCTLTILERAVDWPRHQKAHRRDRRYVLILTQFQSVNLKLKPGNLMKHCMKSGKINHFLSSKCIIILPLQKF